MTVEAPQNEEISGESECRGEKRSRFYYPPKKSAQEERRCLRKRKRAFQRNFDTHLVRVGSKQRMSED